MSARRVAVLVSLALSLATSCGLGPRVTVVVELQTDLAPGLEFTTVRTSVGDEVARTPAGGTVFLRPARVAELMASPGTVRVLVELLDDLDRVRAERLLIVQVRRATGVVAFISAQCRGVTCRGETQTCIRGTCQDARSVCDGEPCSPGGSECTGSECDRPLSYCPVGVCDLDCAGPEDCPAVDPCSTMSCESSVCVGTPREGSCPHGFFCAVGVGCLDIPEGVDAGVPTDGGVPMDADMDGGDVDAGIDYCTTCTTDCGTLGFGVCERGVFTGECHPPEELCNAIDDDCDDRVDEGLDCGHDHPIVCEVRWTNPVTLEPEMTLADNFEGGGPGLVCAGGICTSTITNCRTLMGGTDGHTHSVRLGGSGALTITDDTPFPVTASVSTASGHSHGARCGLGTTAIEVAGGLAFHRIAPMGDDEEQRPAGRYDHFCVPPVGNPSTACFPAFGFCRAR